MSDPETVEIVRDVIFDACPLRTVLKKPCPYFGASKSCRDCRYDWMSIARNVRKLVEKRRASYERERDKVKEVQTELRKKEAELEGVENFFNGLASGLEAVRWCFDRLSQRQEQEGIQEGSDGGISEAKNTQS